MVYTLSRIVRGELCTCQCCKACGVHKNRVKFTDGSGCNGYSQTPAWESEGVRRKREEESWESEEGGHQRGVERGGAPLGTSGERERGH